MPESAPRLPARPSLEQLRKQAKDLLKQYRTGDTAAAARFHAMLPRLGDPVRSGAPSLADAQFVLAREHGFDSWARLVHHIELVRPSSLEQFERLAKDFVAAYRWGDADALQRLGDLYSRKLDLDQLRAFVRERSSAPPGGERPAPDFTLADAELLVARQHGFTSWAALVESAARPPSDPRTAAHGMSLTPPFYRIDWKKGILEPLQPLSEKDWDTIVGVMDELAITGLSANGQMTDIAMERVSRLGQLTHLNVGGSTRLTDDGLRYLARTPRLQDLELGGWESTITDRGLEVLRHLRELRRFQACWSRRISDAGVANLTVSDQLESVNLLGTPTGDGAIDALRGKGKLRQLKTGRLVTDAGLALLADYPVFRTWRDGEMKYELMSPDAEPNHLLVDGPFTDMGLASLVGLDGLFGLSFFWHVSALTAGGLEALASLPNLGFLGCEGKLCNDEAMRHIATIPRLRMLMAQGTVAGDAGFAALSRSRSIEYIWGRECPNLTGPGFAAMAAMPALRGLAVSCRSVDDAALSALPRFAALRELMPMDVTDEGFRHVGRCEKLEGLWCMYCRDTTDVATGHIAGLSGLKTYYAGKTRITDRSLEILARMPSLERLEFWQTAGITNVGVAALTRLPRLRELSIDGSRGVTREVLAMFPASVRVSYSA